MAARLVRGRPASSVRGLSKQPSHAALPNTCRNQRQELRSSRTRAPTAPPGGRARPTWRGIGCGHLVQGDAGGHARVQRLGGGRDRDPDQYVAGLGHDPGQAAALRPGHQDQRGGGQVQVTDRGLAGPIQARHEDTGVQVGLQLAALPGYLLRTQHHNRRGATRPARHPAERRVQHDIRNSPDPGRAVLG